MSDTRYILIDSGHGRKLERFGSILLERPSGAAIWQPLLAQKQWEAADAVFLRDPDNRWQKKRTLPESWITEIEGIKFKLQTTDFGHLGIFPEQKTSWRWIRETISKAKASGEQIKVLNLFAYSGGSTLAAAKIGAQVCHLDASKGMVNWARENAALNGLTEAPIRWIVDDVFKFLKRELRRESRYEGIILDPPTFGRGNQGEVFKIEENIIELLSLCKQILSDKPLFFLLSCHTPGFTPIAMNHLLVQSLQGLSGKIESGEMILEGDNTTLPLPSGTYARWCREF